MIKECGICPHHCRLDEGQTGFCHARSNQGGKIIDRNYGKLTSLALDPIEKKPLRRFYPGSKILSAGSFGCNLRCPFCQNCEISMAESANGQTITVTPETLVERALKLKPAGNIGIAYTYNEPLIGYEFVRDCSKLARENGLKNVVVSNGTVCEQPLIELLPWIDAMNIDLKGFTNDFYRQLSGNLETVKRSIELSSKSCHVEITTLIIPGMNDSEMEMDALSQWLASLGPEIPLHVTRFFPHWKMTDRGPTPVKTVYHLANVARRNLRYVYEGNC